MLFVEFDSQNGFSCPDGKIDEFVRSTIEKYDLDSIQHQDTNIIVSNELIITAFRVAVHRDIIPHDQIKFLFNGGRINIDKDGRLDRYPDQFCDKIDYYLSELLEPKVIS